MQITDGRDTVLPYVDSYRPGAFVVRGTEHAGSIFVARTGVWPWAHADLAATTPEIFAPLLAAEPDLDMLIVGCGRNLRRLPAPLARALKARGIVAEPMDTGAACRTFNLLMMERRRVGAALIAL
jgi:uncharacterized protein